MDFDVDISITNLFSDLWAYSKPSDRELIFLHRDVVLLVFYNAMLFVLAALIWKQRRAQKLGDRLNRSELIFSFWRRDHDIAVRVTFRDQV